MPTATKQNGPCRKDQGRGQTPAYLTTPEAADVLRMTESWLERARWLGDGPPYVKLGAAVRYPVDDLHAFMRARMRTSTTEGAAVDLINENPPIGALDEDVASAQEYQPLGVPRSPLSGRQKKPQPASQAPLGTQDPPVKRQRKAQPASSQGG